MIIQRIEFPDFRTCMLACALALVAVVLTPGYATRLFAVTIYSYIDEQGNPVYTDTPESIPDKYRAKVKSHEQPSTVSTSPSMLQSVRRTVKEQTKDLGITVPSLGISLEGFNQTQSRILLYAGAGAVMLIMMMYLSRSQLVRTLGFCLLIVVSIGAPVLIYVSDGGPMDTLGKKATAAGQAQQDRLQQISR